MHLSQNNPYQLWHNLANMSKKSMHSGLTRLILYLYTLTSYCLNIFSLTSSMQGNMFVIPLFVLFSINTWYVGLHEKVHQSRGLFKTRCWKTCNKLRIFKLSRDKETINSSSRVSFQEQMISLISPFQKFRVSCSKNYFNKQKAIMSYRCLMTRVA